MSKKVFLSIVITAHNEGIIAHKTMRSVLEAANRLKKKNYRYEIIVHIDNGDYQTRNYFSRYSSCDNVSVYENTFGDLGTSRNFAVGKAKGEYITFIDADDLISPNWYENAIERIMKQERDCILHPEAVLSFRPNKEYSLNLQRSSTNELEDALFLIADNCWTAVAFAKREVFEKYPYKKMSDGYCFEDYLFNTETIAAGIKHDIVPGTVLFYRRSDNSMLSVGNKGNAILPYTELFDFGFMTNASIEDGRVDLNRKTISKRTFRDNKVYRAVRRNWFLNYLITPFARLILIILRRDGSSKQMASEDAFNIPKFVIDEWSYINHIETQLFPFYDVVKRVVMYSVERQVNVGRSYVHLSRQFTHYPDYIFIVPWVVRGGADKVLLNYIKALKQINPNWHFTVITTLNVDNTWKDKLPDYVDLMEFGKMAYELPDEQKDVLFSRLITQLKCKKLHIINSEYGYEWVRRHKVLIEQNYDLRVSFFAIQHLNVDNIEVIVSYSNPALLSVIKYVDKVFTDNKTVISQIQNLDAYDSSFFAVHYQPVQTSKMMQPRRGLRKPGKLHILWASRIVPTKLPDLVAKIGEKISVDKITIDVYGEFSSEIKSNIFNNIQSINYCGKFDGFDNIPTEKYDMLLYTSIDDGVPNILLEAAAAGLPIIASNDGGVGEFIVNNETGILIEDYLNPDSYVKKMEWAIDNFDNLANMAKNAQKKLLQQHSWDGFVDKVRRDIG